MMSLFFTNSTSNTIYAAYAYPDSDCHPTNYSKMGWHRIEPGDTREVWSGSVGATIFYYYAEDHSWRGTYRTRLPRSTSSDFHWCWNYSSGSSRRVGMRRLPIDDSIVNFTLEFITSTSKSKPVSKTTHKALPSKSADSGIRRIPKRPTRFKKGTPVPVKSKR
ncbi:hypothetical protein GMA19_00907 [Paenibacillus polymyxa E681]|uniref:DUF1036 domain-containing protein n=1 Tax=Paenibacillus polymyxa TaxID=1406 RepID=UPI00130D5102|nr:DUF1036 domain-containing protein [Paenibacillus polymyxa]QNV55755.1 hypothetical protein GE561_00908 [Paenibacillus polymyxa E681]QNV60591.1 hypothetical protein GMA19_00907 [Paenibacillus polymyxa E681]